MTRLARLRRELLALADSHVVMVPCETIVGTGSDAQTCALCGGCGTRIEPHPLAAPLRGIAWSLLPREERYATPEHGGGPLTSGIVDADRAAEELIALCGLKSLGLLSEDQRAACIALANNLRTAVVQARPGETLDDVLRREGLELAEEACTTCEEQGWRVAADHPEEHGRVVRCGECREGRVIAEDAIEVRVAGQVRYARRR